MKVEEKRKLYKCGKKYKELKDVPTWPEYFEEKKEKLLRACKWSSGDRKKIV